MYLNFYFLILPSLLWIDSIDPDNMPAVEDSQLREDICQKNLGQEDLLRNAPDSAKGQIRVPKVVDA